MVDPATIIEGIRQFGLAPDGSDLRDLEVAYADLERQIAALIKDIDRLQTKAAVAVDRAREVERQLAEARAQSDRFCDKYLVALKRTEAAEAERDRLAADNARLEVENATLRMHAEARAILAGKE